MADAVLDHPSISPLHAAICYEHHTGAWHVVDLSSTYGTFVDKQAVVRGALPQNIRGSIASSM